MLSLDLSGRVAVVTGGSRGLGRAVAVLLGRAGAAVVLGYRSRAEAAEETLAALRDAGAECDALAGDISVPGAAEALLDHASERFGGVDLVVANAGVWPPEDVEAAELTDERWRATIAANLDGAFFTVRAAARAIRPGGRIVVIGSTAGQRGEAGHADYAASKGALSALVKSVAVELAPRDVTVNCVAPGWIDTKMVAPPFAEGRAGIEAGIPLGRVASAEDVAGPVVFLCTDLARHITGEVLNVNGGAVLCG